MSFVILAKSETQARRPSFRGWIRDHFPERFKDRIKGCTVTIALDSEPDAVYDVVIEGDGGSRALFEEIRDTFMDQGAVMTAYSVARMVEKTPPAARLDQVKLVACLGGDPAVSRIETRRHWNEHVPLALRIHIGASRYLRNWVEGLILTSEFSPRLYVGIAMMSFHTVEDYKERLFDIPENVKVIRDDMAEFSELRDNFLGQETLIGW